MDINSNLKELESKMENVYLNDRFVSNRAANKTTLKIVFNKEHVVEVNKDKLLEKSFYFKSVTISFCAEHQSEYVEVNIPASFEAFRQVMFYITTEFIDINHQNIFEISHIAHILQMEGLDKICSDNLVNNPNLLY